MTDEEKTKMRYEIILKTANMPKRCVVTQYEENNKQVNEYMNKVAKMVAQGNGLYLWGDTKTGKTTAGCAILKRYAMHLAKNEVFGLCPVFFVNIPEFLNEWKRDWDRFGEDKVTPAMIEAIKFADLVVFDDVSINVKGLDQRERNILYEMINYRVNEMKASVFTSNNDPYELESMVGIQLYRRIVEDNTEIRMNERWGNR